MSGWPPDGWVDSEPTEDGWYAVMRCYDAEEGTLPGAEYWDEGKWGFRGVYLHSPQTFVSEEAARAWASAYDSSCDYTTEERAAILAAPVEQPPVQETFLVLGPEFNILTGGTITVKVN